MTQLDRIVITGVGLTAPNGNDAATFRANLLAGISGVKPYNIRHFGDTVAGVCDFDPRYYQTRKQLRNGTRAGSIAVYCCNESLKAAGLNIEGLERDRIGVYVGITEHGNVETEHEIHNVAAYDFDLSYWSHYHNPRTVANSPAGEVTLNLGITGPHYTVGAACAAGNLGIVQGVQQLQLGEVDIALAGGVSESIHTFGIFASFNSQNALAWHEDATKASRPFDKARNGIVVSEGGAMFVLERLEDALAGDRPILGEILGSGTNSDASDYVLPNSERQESCINKALKSAGLAPEEIDLVNTHATGTPAGDRAECKALQKVFSGNSTPYFNNTKSMIGHCMGGAGALELAGNLNSFKDGMVHPTINLTDLDPECELPNLVSESAQPAEITTILNNSFGMMGINSTLIVSRYSS